MRFLGLSATGGMAVLALALSACAATTPDGGSTQYKSGSLGNGSFLFACDDSVACSRWNDNAANFPTAITTGSTFELRFVATADQGNTNVSVGKEAYPGLTLEAIAPYVGHGPEGFAALQPGYGLVVAHDSSGAVVDYVTLHVVAPDALVVYDAAYTGTTPTPIDELALTVGDQPQFRTVGMKSLTPTAGSINVAWTSADPSVVAVQTYDHGVVTLRALKKGTTTITAVGAALTKPLQAVVK